MALGEILAWKMIDRGEIRSKLEDEGDGLYSYTYRRIDFFNISDGDLEFFIHDGNGVSDEQIDVVVNVLCHSEQIEKTVFKNIEKMLASRFGDNEIDLEDVELGCIVVLDSTPVDYVLSFELFFDDHSFDILMHQCKIKEYGGEYDTGL